MKRLLAVLLVLFATASLARAGDEKPSAPVKVVVGAYVDRVTEMSLRENRFKADFYVWFRWSGGDKDFDPLKTFDVANGAVSQRSGEVHQELKDGHYASCRCEAEVTEFFDVSRFPFDDHVLRLEIEDTEKEAEFVQYAPDAENSGVASSVQVPGWRLAKAACEVKPHRYATNYGNTDLAAGEGSTYSQFSLAIPLERGGAGYFMKLFFGLFVAVGIALLTFFIKPTDLDPRFGLPVGAIFAAVGSLYVTSQLLPDTNSITLSDKLHILAFVTIFVSLLVSTWSLHLWSGGHEERSRRLDTFAFRGVVVFYVVGSLAAVLLS